MLRPVSAVVLPPFEGVLTAPADLLFGVREDREPPDAFAPGFRGAGRGCDIKHALNDRAVLSAVSAKRESSSRAQR